MTERIASRNLGLDVALALIMEYGIYLFVLLMFAARFGTTFGTLRELGLYVPPVLWLLKCLLRKDFDLDWKEPIFICVLILSASAVASSMLSEDPVTSLSFFKKDYMKVILLYVVISTVFSDNAKLKRLSFFLAFTGIVYLFAGTYKIITVLLREGLMAYGGRIRYYATIFLFFLPFLMLQSVKSENYKKILWNVSAAWSIAGLFFLNVRGSWLGLIGVFIVWIYFLRDKINKKIGILKGMIPVIGAAVIIIIIVFLFSPAQYEIIKKHTSQKLQISLRFEAWETYLKMSGERILFGHGLDDVAMSEHYREFYRSVNDISPPEGKPVTPHNKFIKILYQQGIVGLAACVILIFVFIYRMAKGIYMNQAGNFSLVGVAILSVVTAEIVRWISEDKILVPFGILLGMAGAFLKKRRE